MKINATVFKNEEFENLSKTVCRHCNEFDFLKITDAQTNNDHYPKSFYAAGLSDSACVPKNVLDVTREFIKSYEQQYDVICTLAVYYPESGFIGWHNNGNFDFYNLICTFSDTGDSFFEYIVDDIKYKIHDPKGWSYKQTKWNTTESIMHRAISKCNRITITFSSKKKNNIEKLIKDLED